MEEILKELRKLLGLDDKADGQAICKAVGALKSGVSLIAIAKAAELAETATGDQIAVAVAKAFTDLKAAKAGTIDPAKFVPVEQHTQLATALAKLQNEIATDKADEAVDDAIGAGKIVPAQREWALGYAKAKPEDFAAFVKAQPVIVAPGARPGAGNPPPAADRPLDETEKAVCRASGLTEEAFKKSRAQTEARN